MLELKDKKVRATYASSSVHSYPVVSYDSPVMQHDIPVVQLESCSMRHS
jgi:hypothetical protein